MTRRYFKLDKLLLLVIVIISVILRTMGARFGLPYKWYWDEAKIFWFAYRMILDRTVIPEFFRYGSPTMYLESALMLLLGYGSKLLVFLGYSGQTIGRVAESFGQDVPAWPISNLFMYYSVYLGRVIGGFLAGLSSLVVYLLAREVFDRRDVGLLAAAINAILFLQVQQSWILIRDNVGYLFVGLTVLLALYYYRTERWWVLWACGLSAGTTISIKQSLVPLLIVPLVACYFRPVRKDHLDRYSFSSWETRVLKASLALAFVLLPFPSFHYATTASSSNIVFFGRYTARRLGFLLVSLGILPFLFYLLVSSNLLVRLLRSVFGKHIRVAHLFAGFFITAALFNLGLVFRTQTYYEQLLRPVITHFGTGYKGALPSGLRMLYWILEYFYLEGLGPIFFLMSVVGLLGLMPFWRLSPSIIGRRLILVCFPAAYFGFQGFIHLFVLRDYLPLSIFLALFAAYGCIVVSDSVKRFLHRWDSKGSWARWAGVSVAGLLLVGGSFHHFSLIGRMLPVVMSPDTRTEALSWLARQPELESATILLDSELDFSPVELKDMRLGYISLPVRLDAEALQGYKELGVDVVVTSLFKIEKSRNKEMKKQAEQIRQEMGCGLFYHCLPRYYYDLYRKLVREASRIEVDHEAAWRLSLLAEFKRPEHKNVLGTDHDAVHAPGIVELTDRPGSVSVILNPDIVVYRLTQ